MFKGKLTELFQRHVWCLIIGFFLILVPIATRYYGSDSEAGNNLSLASAIASIILALVAILYAAISAWRSELNVVKMQQLIEDGQSLLGKKVDKVVDATGEAARQLEKFREIWEPAPPGQEEDVEAEAIDTDFKLNLTTAPYLLLMVIYSVVMAHKAKRLWLGREIAYLLFPKWEKVAPWTGYSLGCLQVCACFLEPNSISDVAGRDRDVAFKIEKLPSNLHEYVKQTLESRIKLAGLPTNSREEMKETKYRIDAYFESGQAPPAQSD